MIYVLTLSWDGLDKLQRLKPGLIKNLNKLELPWTWYIRDNGSKNSTAEEISVWDGVCVLAVNHNRDNFSQGINSLADLVKSFKDFDLENDIYLLLNNDIEFFDDDDSLNKMYRLLTPEIGVVGARLLYSGTNRLQHAGVIMSDRYGRMPYHYRHKEESDITAEKNRYFQAVTGAVLMVRAKDFHAVGGLDQKLSWAFEDISFCLELGKLGKKNIYCGETKIYHDESFSLKKNPVNKMFLNSNVKHFKEKWFGKYEIDHDKYLADKNYNAYQG